VPQRSSSFHRTPAVPGERDEGKEGSMPKENAKEGCQGRMMLRKGVKEGEVTMSRMKIKERKPRCQGRISKKNVK
jgi:hypothetical protein